MGEPKTIAGFTLSQIATGATLAASALSAIGALRAGQAQQQEADYRAKQDRIRAQRERELAALKEKEFRRDESRRMAARRAALGASGVDIGEGSPLLVAEDMAAEAEYKALILRAGGEAEATRLEDQAALGQWAGKQQRKASYVRAGSLLVSGVGKAYA